MKLPTRDVNEMMIKPAVELTHLLSFLYRKGWKPITGRGYNPYINSICKEAGVASSVEWFLPVPKLGEPVERYRRAHLIWNDPSHFTHFTLKYGPFNEHNQLELRSVACPESE